jgi:hypothetical protein
MEAGTIAGSDSVACIVRCSQKPGCLKRLLKEKIDFGIFFVMGQRLAVRSPPVWRSCRAINGRPSKDSQQSSSMSVSRTRP